MRGAPGLRIVAVNGAAVNADGAYVLYWMVAARRAVDNFALDRALWWCGELGLPLLVLEPLRAGYPHASDRLHRFVLDGMRDNANRFARARIAYYPYVEREVGDGRGLLSALAEDAAVVVTDEHPGFFFPRMLKRAARVVSKRFEAIDGNGMLPLRAIERERARAVDFRRDLQRIVRHHLDAPHPTPRCTVASPPSLIPRRILEKYPPVSSAELERPEALVAQLPVDHAIAPVDDVCGGSIAAEAELVAFVARRLDTYGARADATAPTTSGLSPYLHFGHVSVHAVFRAVASAEGWSADRLEALRRDKRKASGG